MRVPFAN
jgi:tRNA(Arg) A34 adenosine deaminase TadA